MHNIDKDFAQAAQGKVIKKRKSPLGGALFLVVGAAIAMVVMLNKNLGLDPDMASGLMMVGWCIALIGVIRLPIVLWGPSWSYFDGATGEKLRKYEFSYEASQRERVREYVSAGNFEKLAGLGRSNVSAIKVTLYATAKHEVMWAQVFEFIPHEHVPMTDPFSYDKGKSLLPASLA